MIVHPHAAEGSTTADSAIQTITVSVTPVPEAPVLGVSDAVAVSSSVNRSEERRVGKAPTSESDAYDNNNNNISGLTATASLRNNGGPLTAVAGVYTLSVAQLAGLTPPDPDIM